MPFLLAHFDGVESVSRGVDVFVPAMTQFPNHRDKQKEKALFSAADFHRYDQRTLPPGDRKVPPDIIFVFNREWEAYLDGKCNGLVNRRYSLYKLNDQIGIRLMSGLGAPAISIAAEDLAAIGARRFIIVGLAGGLQPGLEPGSFVVCNAALRDEGTSHHYVREGRYAYPSPTLTSSLRKSLSRKGMQFAQGPTWTTDAFYRETVPELRRYRDEGIMTVDMEASALFTVARVRRRRAAALFVVSDSLNDGGWEPKIRETRPVLRQALDVAIDALAM